MSMVVDNDSNRVYKLTSRGRLVAYNLDDLAEIDGWGTRVEYKSREMSFPIIESGNILYYATDVEIGAADRRDGKKIWSDTHDLYNVMNPELELTDYDLLLLDDLGNRVLYGIHSYDKLAKGSSGIR